PTIDRSGRKATRQDAAAKERSFQGAQAVDAAAAKARGLADRIKPRDRLARSVERPALKIGLDAAEALATDDEFTNRDQRQCLCVIDRLEFAEPDAIAPVVPQVSDPPQLLVV